MQVLDIKIEKDYYTEEVYVEEEEGLTVTVAEPYWKLYINSKYCGSSILHDPMEEFNDIISNEFTKKKVYSRLLELE